MKALFVRHFRLVVFLVLGLPAIVSAQTVTQFFEVTPSSINSGQTVALTWKVTNSSGVSLFLPCVGSGSGIHYKNKNGGLIACDTKLTGFGTIDSVIIGATNTSGSPVALSPKLIPLNSDGSESIGQPTVSFTVEADPNPISDFSVSSATVISGDKLTFTWVAPEVDKLNMTLYCPDEIMPTIVGDSRPRVPCNQQPLFGSDLSGSGSQTFQLSSSSLEPSLVTFRLVPKTGSGAFDGTHSKSIQVTVKPKPDTRNPMITSFQLGEQTLKPNQETKVSWTIQNSVGANFKITCPNGVTATSSLTATSTLKCGQMIFSDILSESGAFIIALKNPTNVPQELLFTLIPAVTSTEFDGVRARTLRVVVLGNPAGITPPTATAAATTSIQSVGAAASTAAAKSAGQLAKRLRYGNRGSEITLLQKILATDAAVYPEGLVTGYFGPATLRAVKRFQTKYKLEAVGEVGPLTRKQLNTIAGAKGIQ